MHRRNERPRRFSAEPLESRVLLAGNVTARLSGNNLLVHGDVNSNVLAITSGSVAGSIVVTGLTDSQGKPTKINGQPNGSVQFNRVTGSLFERGVRVNGVAPGPVWTPLNPADRHGGDVAEFGGSKPMKRPAQPEEIAPAYVFLAAPCCSSYITGEILAIFGGYG